MNEQRQSMAPYKCVQKTRAWGRCSSLWQRFWMRMSGTPGLYRIACRWAAVGAAPHLERTPLAGLNRHGYIAWTAQVFHADFYRGSHVFLDDRVVISQRQGGGRIALGDRVRVYRDTILETGRGATISLGADSSLHPRCQLNAYIAPIEIGAGVMLASSCALFSYDHGVDSRQPIREQPLSSKGPIVIGEEAWLGTGVVVLSGVTIGAGAAIGAGSVVTKDIPENALACGVPARVIRMRDSKDEGGRMK